MINLLPIQQKKEILQEENWRLVLIVGITILAFLICLTLMLFSIKIYISGQVEVQKTFLEAEEEEFKTSELRNLEEELTLTNRTLLELNSFYQEQLNTTEILGKISETLPAGTHLTTLNFTSLTITEKEKYIAQISLSGFAPTREILLEFKKNLEKENLFDEICFPPSNWVKPTDIDFSVNFKITQEILRNG